MAVLTLGWENRKAQLGLSPIEAVQRRDGGSDDPATFLKTFAGRTRSLGCETAATSLRLFNQNMLWATNDSLDKMAESTASVWTSRSAAKVEFFTLVLGVLAIMWVAPFAPQPRLTARVIIGFLIALLLFGAWRERPGLRALGIRLDNFFPVLGRLMVYVGDCARRAAVAASA